jgi:TetR/AcrR family acrAB operon transcriptional repressor
MYVKTMARRTKKEAEATRTSILDAAERVFHERGVAHASLEDVAAAAQVTRGAIYWHFRDKAQLFDAMMQRVMLPVEAINEGADCCAQADPLSLLKRSAVDVLLRTARDPRTRRVFEIAYHKCEYVGDAAGVRDRHIASQRECLGTIEEGLRACVKCGQLPRRWTRRSPQSAPCRSSPASSPTGCSRRAPSRSRNTRRRSWTSTFAGSRIHPKAHHRGHRENQDQASRFATLVASSRY